MRKQNKKTQMMKQRNAEKRAKRSSPKKKQDKLNQRNNTIKAKRKELYDAYVEYVSKSFEKNKSNAI